MALEKETLLPGGVAGNYWKIISTRTDHLSGVTRVVLGLYKDIATRIARPTEFIHSAVFALAGISDPTRADIYNKMRISQIDGEGHETNEWAKAKDILEDGELTISEPK